eukprot:GHVR01025583.1.p1 GENE.GHVR01025583.1~~GHVR01025583.1.p1  ORF type:complete len:614 (-),score=104.58 GHVR01025583.1:622-2463(-)
MSDTESDSFEPKKGFLVRTNAIASLGSFVFGFNLTVMNTPWTVLKQYFNFCQDNTDIVCNNATTWQAIINSAVFVGAAIGCLFLSVLLSRGRRLTLLVGSILNLIGVVISISSVFGWMLTIGRFVSGAAVGLFTAAVPTYIAEITPPPLRGFFGVFNQFGINTGILIGILMGLPLTQPLNPNNLEPPNNFDLFWWRIMFLPAGISGVCMILLLFLFPIESPSYLIDKQRDDDALKVLTHIWGPKNAESILEAAKKNIVVEEKGSDASDSDTSTNSSVSWYQALSMKYYRHALLIAVMMSALQQFSGINVILSKSTEIFSLAGVTGFYSSLASAALGMVNIIMMIVVSFLIDSLNRKTFALIGTFGSFFLLLPAAVSYTIASYDPLIVSVSALTGCAIFSLTSAVALFAFGLGPITWIYISEILPIDLIGSGSSAAAFVQWIVAFGLVFTGTYMTNQFIFIVYSALGLISGFLILCLVRESKGHTKSPYFPDAVKALTRVRFSVGSASDAIERRISSLVGDPEWLSSNRKSSLIGKRRHSSVLFISHESINNSKHELNAAVASAVDNRRLSFRTVKSVRDHKVNLSDVDGSSDIAPPNIQSNNNEKRRSSYPDI